MRSSIVLASIAVFALLSVGFWLMGGFAFANRSAKPQRSRPSAASCSRDRPPGDGPGSRWSGTCKADSDCKEGKNGRCVAIGGGRMEPRNTCSYDACFVDADCGGAAVCECGHVENSGQWPHTCVAADCRTDADCGSGGFCSPSTPLCSRSSGGGHFYCHTLRDECMVDSDCPRPNKKTYGPLDVQCVYSGTTRRWVCMSEECPVG